MFSSLFENSAKLQNTRPLISIRIGCIIIKVSFLKSRKQIMQISGRVFCNRSENSHLKDLFVSNAKHISIRNNTIFDVWLEKNDVICEIFKY